VHNPFAARYFAGAAIAFFALAMCLAGAQIAVARHNTCRLYAPAPPGALWAEEHFDDVVASTSYWPLGDVCDWPRADGRPGSVQSRQGSYPLTVFTYAVAAAGIGSGTAAVILMRRNRRMTLSGA
jgi:hypothetical protein